MEDARLFGEASFVVTRTPGAFGRALLKRVRGVDLAREHPVRDRAGAHIATVVPRTRRWRRALDTYTRFDVVDAAGTRLLALRMTYRTLLVDDAAGHEIGLLHHRVRRGGVLAVSFHAGDRGGGVIRGLPPVIGSIAPRKRFARWPVAFGVMEVLDVDGAAVARVTNTDMFHNVVEIEPSLDGPLRLLTVGFACSLVDHRWMHIRTQRTP